MHRSKLFTCTNNSHVYTTYSKRYFRTRVKSRVMTIRPPCAQCTRGECTYQRTFSTVRNLIRPLFFSDRAPWLMIVVLLSADTMLVFGHQVRHKYRSDGITRSVGIMPGEACPLTNIHPNIHVPGQTLAINSNRAPRMRSICPLSVCSSGEYVYVTAEPISLPFSSILPTLPIIPVSIYPVHHQHRLPLGCAGSNRRSWAFSSRRFTRLFWSRRKANR